MTSGFMKAGLVALVMALALPVIPAQAQSLTAAQKAEMGPVIKDYLMENPQVIMEAVEKFRQNQEEIENKAATAKIKTSGDALYNDPTSPVVGNPKGDVTLVEFFDYNCGYCKMAFKDVQTLVNEDKGLRVVFKEMPILSEQSHNAARYALAAEKQGKYWEFHQALMSGGRADAKGLEKITKDTGIDLEKLKADAESAEIRAIIEKNLGLARDLGFTGTPAFVLGDAPLKGHYGIDALRKMIADQRAAKKN